MNDLVVMIHLTLCEGLKGCVVCFYKKLNQFPIEKQNNGVHIKSLSDFGDLYLSEILRQLGGPKFDPPLRGWGGRVTP